MNNLSLRIQILFSYIMIATALILSIFSLGFMSWFFIFFLDGTSEMYTYFKDLQILNNAIFNSSLIYLVCTLILKPFDIHKQAASFFGVIYTLIIVVVNLLNGMTVFTTNRYFLNVYLNLDFSSLKDYQVSTAPFQMIYILFSSAILFSFILFITTGLNFVQQRKKGEVHEK